MRLVSRFANAFNHVIDLLLCGLLRHIDNHEVNLLGGLRAKNRSRDPEIAACGGSLISRLPLSAHLYSKLLRSRAAIKSPVSGKREAWSKSCHINRGFREDLDPTTE
jgi:hypothetical protein